MRVLMPDDTFTDSKHTQRVRKLLEARKPLWVVNTSDAMYGVRAVHFITFTDQNGKTKSINFPDTYLPICITNKVDHDTILQSADFWAYINAGLLRAIPPKKASVLLGTEDASEEKERLQLRSRGSRGNRGDKLRRQSGVRPTGQTRFDTAHPDDRGRNASAEADTPRVKNRVMAICGRVEAGNLNPRSACAELRNMRLSREDLGYVMGNARYRDPETGDFDDTVCNWANEQLIEKSMKLARKRGGTKVDPVREILGGKKAKKSKAKRRKKSKR